MRRLGEILRNEYIGAITIGFLLFQTAGDVINVVMQPVATYIQNRNRPQSVLASQSIFNWPQLILGLTDAVLHLLVVLLLIAWLYHRRKIEPAVSPKEPQTKP